MKFKSDRQRKKVMALLKNSNIRKRTKRKKRFRKFFKGQRFEKVGTHTNVNKKKFRLGTIWFDKAQGVFGRVVGYPLNDYYYDKYVGMAHFNEKGEFIGYGASRSDTLKKTTEFPKGFRPKYEPRD